MTTKHEVGKCDICHKDYTGEWPGHGIIHDVGVITRYCNECWKEVDS